MGGIIGRLFREFVVRLSIAVVVSGIVALTLTPTLCAICLGRQRAETRENIVIHALEKGLDRLTRLYEITLDATLRHRRTTLALLGGTLAATVVLFAVIPKGFFRNRIPVRSSAPRMPSPISPTAPWRGKRRH